MDDLLDTPKTDVVTQEEAAQTQQVVTDVETQQTQQNVNLDPDQLAEKIAGATVQAQHMAEVHKQNAVMTPEQEAEHFKTFNVTEDFTQNFVQALRPDEEGKVDAAVVAKVIEQMRDGIVGQSVRASELMQQQAIQQIQASVAPVQQFAQQQQAEQAWTSFEGKFPHLKDYRKVVDIVSGQLAASGYKPKTNDELFATVASQVEEHIKTINPNANFPTKQDTTTPMGGVAMPGNQSVVNNAPENENTNYDAEIFG